MTMRMGLPIMPPDPFDVDMTASYKAAVAAEEDGKGMAFALEVCDARWGERQEHLRDRRSERLR